MSRAFAQLCTTLSNSLNSQRVFYFFGYFSSLRVAKTWTRSKKTNYPNCFGYWLREKRAEARQFEKKNQNFSMSNKKNLKSALCRPRTLIFHMRFSIFQIIPSSWNFPGQLLKSSNGKVKLLDASSKGRASKVSLFELKGITDFFAFQ